MRCCGSISCYDAHLTTAPQHLVCKYELNCEYHNITLARNKAPWWWSDTIETCRSVLKCLKVFYVKLYVHSLVDKLKWYRDILEYIIRNFFPWNISQIFLWIDILKEFVTYFGGPDSVVDTAIRYGVDSSVLETPWGKWFFYSPHPSR